MLKDIKSFGNAVLLLAMAALVLLSYFDVIGPEEPPQLPDSTLADYLPNLDEDDSFTWFPDTVYADSGRIDTVKILGPIRWRDRDPEIVYVDSSREQLIALQDYIKRQYMFRIRYAEPRLQVSFISMDSISADTVRPVYELREYTVLPGFEIEPTLGGYQLRELTLDKPSPESDTPLFTYQYWAGLNLVQADMPMSFWVRADADWKTAKGSIELHLDADANVTARIGIGVRLR